MDSKTISISKAASPSYESKNSQTDFAMTTIIIISVSAGTLFLLFSFICYRMYKKYDIKKKTIIYEINEAPLFNDQSSAFLSSIVSSNEFSSDSVLNEPLVEVKPDFVIVPSNLSAFAKN